MEHSIIFNDDIIPLISHFLPLPDIFNMSLVCKDFRCVVNLDWYKYYLYHASLMCKSDSEIDIIRDKLSKFGITEGKIFMIEHGKALLKSNVRLQIQYLSTLPDIISWNLLELFGKIDIQNWLSFIEFNETLPGEDDTGVNLYPNKDADTLEGEYLIKGDLDDTEIFKYSDLYDRIKFHLLSKLYLHIKVCVDGLITNTYIIDICQQYVDNLYQIFTNRNPEDTFLKGTLPFYDGLSDYSANCLTDEIYHLSLKLAPDLEEGWSIVVISRHDECNYFALVRDDDIDAFVQKRKISNVDL